MQYGRSLETPRPVAGSDYPGTYQELLAWFPDNAACIAHLEKLRWPDGFTCPVCGAREYWRTKRGLLMCANCGRKTSVTAGTIFHRTRTPLATWFAPPRRTGRATTPTAARPTTVLTAS